MDENLYLCTAASRAETAAERGKLCRMEYLLGDDGTLLCSGTRGSADGELLGLSAPEPAADEADPEPLSELLTEECLGRNAAGLLCDFEGGADAFRIRLCRRLADRFAEAGLRLYLPEAFGSAAPGAIRLVSAAVAGEPCAEAFRRAVLRYGPEHTALLCEPISADYPLPMQGAAGRRLLNRNALAALLAREHAVSYFSQELCARYFTYREGGRQSRFVIFDDIGTLQRKISLARSCGIREVFLCEADSPEALH